MLYYKSWKSIADIFSGCKKEITSLKEAMKAEMKADIINSMFLNAVFQKKRLTMQTE